MNPDEHSNDSDILEIGLTIFNQYVTIEDKNPEEDKLEPAVKMNLIKKQNFLVKIGLVELICKICCKAEKMPKIFGMALKVAIKILGGGNKSAQLEFLKVFKTLEDKNIINTLINVIKVCFDGIENTMVIKNNNSMKSLLLGKKNTVFHDSSLHKYDDLLKKLTIVIRFFQLLCEGHNMEL
jgi:hypothetical protein